MRYRLFLDDMRDPTSGEWAVARTSIAAIALVERNGCPQEVSFDHDLGGDDTAMFFVRWLIDRDMDEVGFIPIDFRYFVHSANPVGRANIDGLMSGYLSFRAQQNVAAEAAGKD